MPAKAKVNSATASRAWAFVLHLLGLLQQEMQVGWEEPYSMFQERAVIMTNFLLLPCQNLGIDTDPYEILGGQGGRLLGEIFFKFLTEN